ncbi:MAG: thymidylate synthase [Melioribacteraceae bacterium]|nr:thymidylate synthase [Melioribacteraceae bacterium]
MNSVTVNSANELWFHLVKTFKNNSKTVIQKSRVGDNKEILHYWITITDPIQRFMTMRYPSINPAFAIAEIVWIINGRNDSMFLNKWNSQLCKYAGYDDYYHGAYGYRLRKNFQIDQLKSAYEALKNDTSTRQIVLQIWDSKKDLPFPSGKAKSKDIPCNITSLLKIRDNKLEWVQIMRSNDMFRGLPYNIIQFTTLQEILAGWLGIKPGNYYHFSDSLHLYNDDKLIMKKKSEFVNSTNSDSIHLSYKESKSLFKQFEHKIEQLINSPLTPKKLISINNWDSAPQSFRNMLSLLTAEAARKIKYDDVVTEIIAGCSNPCFTQMWNNWANERNN